MADGSDAYFAVLIGLPSHDWCACACKKVDFDTHTHKKPFNEENYILKLNVVGWGPTGGANISTSMVYA